MAWLVLLPFAACEPCLVILSPQALQYVVLWSSGHQTFQQKVQHGAEQAVRSALVSGFQPPEK